MTRDKAAVYSSMVATVDERGRLDMDMPDDIVIDTVVQTVAEAFNVSADDILGDGRPENVVDARRAIAIVLSSLGYKVRTISKALNRERTTAYNLLDTAKQLLETDPSFRAKVFAASRAVWVMS